MGAMIYFDMKYCEENIRIQENVRFSVHILLEYKVHNSAGCRQGIQVYG